MPPVALDRSIFKIIILYYLLASICYYAASWIAYGGFNPGHPSLLNLEEYLSSAGIQFGVSLILSISVWKVFQFLQDKNNKLAFWFVFLIIPVFSVGVFLIVKLVQSIFGWVFIWSGSNTIWILLMIGLFYTLHIMVVFSFGFYNNYQKAQKRNIHLEHNLMLREAKKDSTKTIKVSKGSRSLYIELGKVLYFEAFGDYSRVHTEEEVFLSNLGISKIEKMYSQDNFLRIHRSYLVNMDYFDRIEKNDRYYYLFLSSLHSLKVSQHYLPKVKERIS